MLICPGAGNTVRYQPKRHHRDLARGGPLVAREAAPGVHPTDKANLPEPFVRAMKNSPKVFHGYRAMGKAAHAAGRVEGKSRDLVRMDMAIGAGLEGARVLMSASGWRPRRRRMRSGTPLS